MHIARFDPNFHDPNFFSEPDLTLLPVSLLSTLTTSAGLAFAVTLIFDEVGQTIRTIKAGSVLEIHLPSPFSQ